jgi:hypothetical protein
MMTLKSTRMLTPPRKQVILLTAAAALSSSSVSNLCYAFIPQFPIPQNHGLQRFPPDFGFSTMQSRLYSSNNKNPGIFDGLKKFAKSVLPKSLTQSEEERKAEIVRKETQKDISSGIQSMLKDAPLAIRMVGSLVAPILSSLTSAVQEQQRQTENLLDEARSYILSNENVLSDLGEPITIQPPFSQSSSSASINGKSSSQVNASFYVQGIRRVGVGKMVATETGIQNLSLTVDGRTYNIPLTRSGGPGTSKFGIGKNRINQDDVIDVEFVEKKVNKK